MWSRFAGNQPPRIAQGASGRGKVGQDTPEKGGSRDLPAEVKPSCVTLKFEHTLGLSAPPPLHALSASGAGKKLLTFNGSAAIA